MTRPHSDSLPRSEEEIRSRVKLALAVLAVFAAFHAIASWGYAGSMWSEHGRWLHSVERVAAGQLPYRDFEWSNPPLPLWVMGLVARVTGTGLAAVSVSTVAVYTVLLAVFFTVVLRLTRELAFPVTLATLLFTTAYAGRTGVPLPLGTAIISIPFAVTFLLGTVLFAHDMLRSGRRGAAVGTGICAALTLASAHAMWLPAIYMLVASTILLRRSGRPAESRTLLAAFAATVVAWLVLQSLTSGPASVARMLTGFDLFGFTLVGSQPTLERLTIEAAAIAAIVLTATTALWLCLAIPDATAGRWAGISLLVFLCASATHLGMSVARGTQLAALGPSEWPSLVESALLRSLAAGQGLIPAALGVLDTRFQSHLFPVMLPAFLLVVLASRWNRWADTDLRNLVAIMLGLCLSTRIRSGFRGSDWYNVLLEIPAYVLMLRLGGAARIHQAGRAVLAALGIMIVLGLYAYGSLARGVLTFRGRYPAIETARGSVHWAEGEARQYRDALRLLDQADPTRSRPMLAFGPTAGFNYFLGRANPTPLGLGFYAVTAGQADSIVSALQSRREVLLLDHPFVRRSEPRGLRPWSWDPRMGPSRHVRVDRPYFDRLIGGCSRVPADSSVVVAVYDCR